MKEVETRNKDEPDENIQLVFATDCIYRKSEMNKRRNI